MKAEKWIRQDLQEKYDELTNEQQPWIRKHRELCEQIRRHKINTGQNDVASLSQLREGSKILAELEEQKQKLWKENLDTFYAIAKSNN